MATTQAFVLEDGEVIGKSVLDGYALKGQEDGSKQLPSDLFADAYGQQQFIEPLYNLEGLARLLEISTPHYRACKTKARDTAGIGWFLEPSHEDKENPSENEKSMIEQLIKRPNPEESFSEFAEKVEVDYESTGNGYIEVVRDPDTRLVSHLLHIPAHTVRVHSSEVLYAQHRMGRRAWFKKFGEEQDYYLDSGNVIEKPDEVDEKDKANEILHLKNYTSRSDYYGLPDVIPSLDALIGDRERQEYNISFFDNHAIPAYAVTVSGADLDEETEKQIKKFFQSDVKNNNHSTLVLSGKKDEDDPTEEPVQFQFEALSTDTKEASFRMFRQDNRDEILSAHGVPPYRAGIVVEGQLGGSSAQETTEIYKQSVISPKQERWENLITHAIIEQGLGCKDWVFRLNDIDTRDSSAEVSRFQRLGNMGVITPNEIREAMGYEKSDNPALDEFYFAGKPLGQTGAPAGEGGADQALMQSVNKLHRDIVQVAKGQDSDV